MTQYHMTQHYIVKYSIIWSDMKQHYSVWYIAIEHDLMKYIVEHNTTQNNTV